MSVITREVSATTTGSKFISPEEIDELKYLGSIFVVDEETPEEIIGVVYHDTDSDIWVLETIDFVSDNTESFKDLFNHYADENFKFLVKE